ncbi:phage fiber-tail adaptor protein [Mycolicibacterium sp. A43C]
MTWSGGNGSIGASVKVPESAGPHVYAVVAAGFGGDVNLSGATFPGLWEGSAMTPLLAAPLLFGGNKQMLMGWIVEDPDPGINDIVFGHNGIPGSLWTNNRFLAVGLWSQAQQLDMATVKDRVVSTVGAAPTTQNKITVPSVKPAHRVISAHFVTGRDFSAFTGARIAAPQLPGGNAFIGNGGQLLLGETRGAASTEPTATQGSIASWASFGLNLAPAPLVAGARSRMRAGVGRVGASVYRYAEPHPDRFYQVPPVGTFSNVVAGNFILSADGVPMPVWPKDPDDTNDYTLDWSNHLAEDDRINHVEHTVAGALRKFSDAVDKTGVRTQVWINGGTVNVNRPVRVRASTARGRRFDRTFWLAGVSN